MSSYMVTKSPNMYGGGQAEYLAQVETIVAETAITFRKALDEGKDLTQLFHTTLERFGRIRHEMALKKNDDRAAYFGTRRDQREVLNGLHILTPLGTPYEEYNEKILPLLQNYLRSMKHDKEEYTETQSKIALEPCLGKAFCLEISIFAYKNLEEIMFRPTEAQFNRFCDVCEIPPSERPDLTNAERIPFDLFDKNLLYMEKLKTKAPADYKKYKFTCAIAELCKKFPENKKSDWIIATLRGSIDGKMYALTQYLTWTYRDYKEDPVEHMTGRSIIGLLHQDNFLVEPTLNEVAKLFKKTMESEKEGLSSIQPNMAMFLFFFDHNMPWLRGTSAATEWFEMSMYRCFGYKLEYDNTRLVNLEALTSIPSDFMKNYPSMIKLTKLDVDNNSVKTKV